MSKNFDFHLFLCLGEDTLKRVLEDIDAILDNEHDVKDLFPNYDFRNLGVLRKRLLYYKQKYSEQLKNAKKGDKVFADISREINEKINDVNTTFSK